MLPKAALKFQPVIRPQQTKQKAKPKPKPNWSSSSGVVPSSGAVTGSSPDKQTLPTAAPAQQPRSKFEDWVGKEDEETPFFFDNRKKPQRGGKKARRKKQQQQNYGHHEEQQEPDWDKRYDPAEPTVYARYRYSTEQDDERREWKEHLYRHKPRKEPASKGKPKNAAFAPPSGFNFAPPSFYDERSSTLRRRRSTLSRSASIERTSNRGSATPVAFTSTSIPDDATGEDAYMRRMRMSGMMSAGSSDPAPLSAPNAQPFMTSSSPVPPRVAAQPSAETAAKLAAAKAKIAAAKAAFEAKQASHPPPPPPPPPEPAPAEIQGATISRAPVRYERPDIQPSELDDRQEETVAPQQQADGPQSKLVGRYGFGARMLEKQGHKAGQGLGARGEGIINPLEMRAEKRKKRSDQNGGGWGPPGVGKIYGGKKAKIDNTGEDDGPYGFISQVVKLSGMLEGLDVTHEIYENNLQQRIGDEFKDYGSIERVYIWREQDGGKNDVFVKFTNQTNARECVMGCDGRLFNGNPVEARFFNAKNFDAGEYA